MCLYMCKCTYMCICLYTISTQFPRKLESVCLLCITSGRAFQGLGQSLPLSPESILPISPLEKGSTAFEPCIRQLRW